MKKKILAGYFIGGRLATLDESGAAGLVVMDEEEFAVAKLREDGINMVYGDPQWGEWKSVFEFYTDDELNRWYDDHPEMEV